MYNPDLRALFLLTVFFLNFLLRNLLNKRFNSFFIFLEVNDSIAV